MCAFDRFYQGNHVLFMFDKKYFDYMHDTNRFTVGGRDQSRSVEFSLTCNLYIYLLFCCYWLSCNVYLVKSLPLRVSDCFMKCTDHFRGINPRGFVTFRKQLLPGLYLSGSIVLVGLVL